MNTDQFLRYFTLILLFFWAMLWKIKEKQADKEKPKTKKPSILGTVFNKSGFYFQSFLLTIELLGFRLWPTPNYFYIQLVGLFLVFIGFYFSVAARLKLAANWTQAYDYQIKKNHRLVTRGIYKYVRHPIYTGLVTIYTGAFLIAQSYFFIPALILLSLQYYFQGKKEEKLLASFFKKDYRK